MGVHMTSEGSLMEFFSAQLEGQFCSVYLSAIWMQQLNATLASLLMITNWEVLLTLSRGGMP